MPSSTSVLRPVATLGAAASLALAAACHQSAARQSPRPSRVVPVAGSCGQRAAVAVTRGRAPRRSSARAATGTGSLVVHVAPADGKLTPPEGPVRVSLASRGTRGADTPVATLLPLTRQVGRTPPLPAGRYVVEATGTGYQPRRLTVVVRPGATDTVRFRLAAMCVRRASR